MSTRKEKFEKFKIKAKPFLELLNFCVYITTANSNSNLLKELEIYSLLIKQIIINLGVSYGRIRISS